MPEVAEQMELSTELANEIEVLANKLADAQTVVEVLKAQLEVAKITESSSESELLKMLDLADKNGKWMVDVRSRLLKISAWTQKKAIPYKQMYDLVYSKLAPQIKNVVDKELAALKVKAGEARRVEIDVLKKGGSLWSTLVNAWDTVKDKMGSIVSSILDTLNNMLGAAGEIESIVTQMEALGHGSNVEVAGCIEMAKKLGLKNIDCKNVDVAKVIARISKLGTSTAEQDLKKLLLRKVGKVADAVSNLLVGDYVTVDISKVKDYDSHEPYVKLVQREVRRGGGKVRVVSLRGDIAEISGLTSGMDILGGIWVPVASLKKEESIVDVSTSVETVPVVAKIIHSKKAEVNGVYVEGSSEEEMLELMLDEIQKQCKCGCRAEDILTEAVQVFKKESTQYSWDDVEYSPDGVYISGDYYGTEEEFFNDIDTGKIKVAENKKEAAEELQLTPKLKKRISDYALKSMYRMNAPSADCYAFDLTTDGEWSGGYDWSNHLVDESAEYLFMLDSKEFIKNAVKIKVAQDVAVGDVAADVGVIVTDAADKVEADVKDAADMIQGYIENNLQEIKTAAKELNIYFDDAEYVELEELLLSYLEDGFHFDDAVDFVKYIVDGFLKGDVKEVDLTKSSAETFMTSGDDKSTAVVDATGKTQIKDKGTGAVKEDRTYANPAEAVSKLTGEGWKA